MWFWQRMAEQARIKREIRERPNQGMQFEQNGNTYTWHVARALGIVAHHKIHGKLDVHTAYYEHILTGLRKVNMAYIGSGAINLRYPLILMPNTVGAWAYKPNTTIPNDPPEKMLLDGAHRLYKAYHSDVDELPYYLLSAKEERSIRVSGPDDFMIGRFF